MALWSGRPTRRHAVSAALILSAALTGTACRSTGVKVASLHVTGTEAFSPATLRPLLRTRQASRLPWARWRPFSQAEFDADLSRLREFYRAAGYPEASVRATEVAPSADGATVRLTIAIDEGAPVRLSSIAVVGTDALAAPLRAALAATGLRPGATRDARALAAERDRALGLLRNDGYPHATVAMEESPGADGVALTMRVTPGPETRYGPLVLNGLSRTKAVLPRRAVTFRPGGLYREREVLDSQRRLSRLPAFEFVHLAPDATARAANAAELPMVVSLVEAKPHRFEIGAGYGTEDRARGSLEWRNVNFFGNGSQWVGNVKYATVLKGAGFGYEHPYLLRTGGTLDVRAGAWWADEATFESRSAGGIIAASHDLGRPNELMTRVRYRHEFLVYQVREEALRDLDSIEERIALGLDPVTGKGDGTVAAMEWSIRQSVADAPSDPRRGFMVSAAVEHAAPWQGGSFRFDEVLVEARGYVPVRGSLRLAGKVRAGTLLARNDATIPFAERYFLGGSSSVRGWGRYEISPTSGGVPIGGRSLLEMSTELRASLGWDMGAVAFLDAGNVWDDPWELALPDLRWAAGLGLRYTTIVGVVRGDFGYQLNPIRNLRIDGAPVTRRWRIHLSLGHAF
jgi:translocation and assembly module TamA